MREIYKSVSGLVNYGIQHGLCCVDDKIYLTNRILDILKIYDVEPDIVQEFENYNETGGKTLSELLDVLLDYAIKNELIMDSIVARDLLDTRIMDELMPRPSEIRKRFGCLYLSSPKQATEYYYMVSKESNYIRTDRIAKDMKWVSDTEYGKLDITINLSKPEKDPKAIAAAKFLKPSSYPKCLLCKENEGYAGRLDHPARQNHRIMPVSIAGENWYFQYSPYVYYNEHCIVFNEKHIPMIIEESTFKKLLDFVEQFPHYFVGSNADLPIVGGSILSHEHFQGGSYEFPMTRAEIEKELVFEGFEDVKAGIVKWPLSVIRLTGNKERLVALSTKILNAWRGYTDEEAFIFAETDGEPHNTITPIARTADGELQIDLVLRNNITTEEHPLGVYHPHEELHHIKKENIGLIEVMGLAVLPARLKDEMEELANFIIEGKDLGSSDKTKSHKVWAEEVIERRNVKEVLDNSEDRKSAIVELLKEEIGVVFGKVLADAGVYKSDEQGRAAFMKFIESIK